tara:strand:+ start:1263 stop:1430 length:168 start_codon:yes stop_codon:yes gene_type:complete
MGKRQRTLSIGQTFTASGALDGAPKQTQENEQPPSTLQFGHLKVWGTNGAGELFP